MSHAQTSHAAPRGAAAPGLPTWAGPALVAAALLVGLAIAVATTSITWVFTALFAAGAFAATLLVNLRGLYLTVAFIPALYGIMSFVSGWGIAALTSRAGGFSFTALITAAYPVVEHFPSLLIVTLACALLAVVRLWLAGRDAKSTQERETATRRATAEAERRNRESASRARERSGRLTVAELAARNEATRRSAATPSAAAQRVRTGERDRDARRREQAAERAQNPTSVRDHAETRRAKPNPNLRAGDPQEYVGRRRLDENLYGDD